MLNHGFCSLAPFLGGGPVRRCGSASRRQAGISFRIRTKLYAVAIFRCSSLRKNSPASYPCRSQSLRPHLVPTHGPRQQVQRRLPFNSPGRHHYSFCYGLTAFFPVSDVDRAVGSVPANKMVKKKSVKTVSILCVATHVLCGGGGPPLPKLPVGNVPYLRRGCHGPEAR